MNKIIFFLIIFIAFIACNKKLEISSSSTTPKTIDEAAETAAIMSVIEAETKCFYERDLECWKQHWVNESYAFQAWNNGDGTFDAESSFDSLTSRAKAYFQKYPVKDGQTASHEKVTRHNMLTKFYDDKVVFLVWDQYNSDNGTNKFTHSKDTRLMEKVNGSWKIVNVSSYWDYKNKYDEKGNKI